MPGDSVGRHVLGVAVAARTDDERCYSSIPIFDSNETPAQEMKVTYVRRFVMAALLLVAGAGFATEIQRISEPFAGLTLGARAQMLRGGRTTADVYRDAFNTERTRMGIPTLAQVTVPDCVGCA